MAGPDDARTADQIDAYTDTLSREMALASIPENPDELQQEMHNIWERLSDHVLSPALTKAVHGIRAKSGLTGILSDAKLAKEPGIHDLLKLARPKLVELLRKPIEEQVDLDLASRSIIQTAGLIAYEGGGRALLRMGKEIRFTKAPLRELLIALRTEQKLAQFDTTYPSLQALVTRVPTDPVAKQFFDFLCVAIAEVDPKSTMLNFGEETPGTFNEGGLAAWLKESAQNDAAKQLTALIAPKTFGRNQNSALLLGYLRSNPNHLADLKAEYDAIIADPASKARKSIPRVTEQNSYNGAAALIDQIHALERDCHCWQAQMVQSTISSSYRTTLQVNIKTAQLKANGLRTQFGLDYLGVSIPSPVSLQNLTQHQTYLNDLQAQANQLKKQAAEAVDVECALSPAELLRRLIMRELERRGDLLDDAERGMRAAEIVASLREKLFGEHRGAAREGALEELAASQTGIFDRYERSKKKRRLNNFLEETVFGNGDADWGGLKGVLVPDVPLKVLMGHPMPRDKMKRLIETFDLLLSNTLPGGGILDIRDHTQTYELRNRLYKVYLKQLANEKAAAAADPASLLAELLAERPGAPVPAVAGGVPATTATPIALKPQDPNKKAWGRIKKFSKDHWPEVVIFCRDAWTRLKAWKIARAAAKAARQLPSPPATP